MDILVDIPAILEQFDEFRECLSVSTQRQEQLRRELVQRCWLYDLELQTWSKISGPRVLTFLEDKIATGKFETQIPSSEDFATVHLGFVYWATCILLYHVLWELAGENRRLLPERINPRQYCRNIATLVPYLQDAGSGAFFINMTTMPVGIAMGFLDAYDPPDQPSEEREMLLESFEGVNGTQSGKCLGTWPWRRWPFYRTKY